MLALVSLLLAAALYDINKGAVAAELDSTLGHGNHVVSLCQYYLGIGAVAGTDLAALYRADGCLHLKLVGTIVLYSLWRNVLQVGVKLQVLHRSDGNLHRHSHYQIAHFGFVDVATEDEVVHVCHASDGGSVIKGVGKNHGVTYFDRNIEDNSRNGRTDEGGRGTGVALGNTITNYFERIQGGYLLLLCLLQRLLHLVKLIGADQLLLVELFLATIVYLCLLQVNFGKAHTSLRRTELSHIRNHLYLGDNLACLHEIACLLADFGDDTADLRLYVHLVARLYLTRNHRGFQYIAHLWGKLGIFHRLRL